MDHPIGERDEYLTIIAPTAAEAMAQFKSQDLAEKGFSIFARMGRHRISVVRAGAYSELFDQPEMVAATFSRKVNS